MIKSLTCYRCHTTTIPAPEGSTEHTRYVCRNCSPLGLPEDLDPEQFPNVDSYFAKHMTPEQLFRLAADHAVDLAQLPSPRILRARLRHEAWVKKLTRHAIFGLPERYRVALVAFYWGGMSARQIGSVLNTTPKAAHVLIQKSKEIILVGREQFWSNRCRSYMRGQRRLKGEPAPATV